MQQNVLAMELETEYVYERIWLFLNNTAEDKHQ